jgi:hypothetical protein
VKRLFKDFLSRLSYLIPFKVFPHLKRDLVYLIYQLRFRTLPRIVRDHRNYFKAEGRGFGEDAFHAAWADVIKRYRPTTALEIGVYRGQTISLWCLLARIYGFNLTVHGLTPMDDSGDSVSSYKELNYEEDIRINFSQFNLPEINLLKEYSDSKAGKDFIKSREWDLVYIDGSHDYLTVLSDFEHAVEAVRVGGLVVLDDSSLYTTFSRSFQGHPGPSKVLRDHPSPRLKLILSVGHNNFFIKSI